MKRNRILTGAVFASIVLFALAGATAAHAAAPFGSFGGKVGGGNAGSGQMPLFGWALDDNGIAAVDIVVDGLIVGRSTYGRSRPQVTQQFPGYPNSSLPGFAYQLDTTRFLNGQHRVQPRVLSLTGEVTLLTSRVFEFNNVTHNLTPFGRIDFPNQNAEMRGKCNDLSEDLPRRYYAVIGWALDSGVQTDDTGVGWVELMIDRAERFNTQSDCEYSPIRGGLTQCYGLRRLDIEHQFPGLPNGPHAGWRFVLDIGALMASGYGPGAHTITIRSGDLFGQVVNIAEMPVTFSCDEDLGNENSFGLIGYPTKALTYAGTVEARGWALDHEGITAVQFYVDGVFQGLATTGIASPGVNAQYPGYPESTTANWTFSLDTTLFSNGRHSINVIVVDDDNARTLIGERDIQIGNPL
ncbi:MAG TPA: Ig-like domain-containing protein [Thermoanaerobaculia bacterium]|jgi:N-acetylmuramoyl-L-alanine amidase|nr:Ig-like domain-containing protein [Thermoanaerobaculia bacterium]